MAVLVSSRWDLRASVIVLVLGSAGVVLALIQLVAEFKSVSQAPAARAGLSYEVPQVKPAGRWGNLEIWAWILGFFLAIHVVGFLVAIPLFVLAYSKIYGANWPTSLALSLVCWGFVYGLFDQVMHVPWPRALLFSFF